MTTPPAFTPQPHPHVAKRRPPRPHRAHHKPGFSGWLALRITAAVSTMACAGLFAALALVALPAAINQGLYWVVVWLSSTFLQLVFLPILAVGQAILGKSGDERAEATFHDASATLHSAQELERHLQQQDLQLATLIEQVAGALADIKALKEKSA
ncbi:MAG: hypothetical protein KGL39_39190 [Patescibacteria group bacterium]|nr:hypothetical protein [Patescibacteria group bacterium]